MKQLNGISMFRFLICATLIILSFYVEADIRELSREYTYKASENDSKLSARKAAIIRVHSKVISDIGFNEQSRFLASGVKLEDADFDIKIMENYSALSQALSNTDILKESWNGEEYYLHAMMTVDTTLLIDKFKGIYAEPVLTCMELSFKTVRLVHENITPEIKSELLELSKKYGFSEDCYGFQFDIMIGYAKKRVDDDIYRKHIFTSIMNQESDSLAGEMLIETLKYALKVKPLSSNEWAAVNDALYRGGRDTFKSVITLLIDHSQNEEPNNPKSNKQPYKQLINQMTELTFSAYNMNIHYSNPVSENEVIYTFLEQGLIKQQALSKRYFLDFFQKLDSNQKNALADKVVEHHRFHFNYDSNAVLINYLGWIDMNEAVANTLFPLIKDFEDTGVVFLQDDNTHSAFENFLEWHKKDVKNIIIFASLSESVKSEWIAKYNL